MRPGSPAAHSSVDKLVHAHFGGCRKTLMGTFSSSPLHWRTFLKNAPGPETLSPNPLPSHSPVTLVSHSYCHLKALPTFCTSLLFTGLSIPHPRQTCIFNSAFVSASKRTPNNTTLLQKFNYVQTDKCAQGLR